MVKVFRKIKLNGKEYAIVGHGAISAKKVKVYKNSKGKYVIFDGKRISV